MIEKAPIAAIQEAYIQGISTGSAGDPMNAMEMEQISRDQVSHVCGEIDARRPMGKIHPIGQVHRSSSPFQGTR